MTYSNTYSSPSSPTNFNPFSGMGMRKGGRPSLFPGSGDGSTLNLDFTTGVLDSRLTFSRASTATFVNSSGYVQFANANCFTFSNPRPSGTAWGTTGTVTWNGVGGIADPIGGTNAQSFNLGTTGSAIFNTAGTIVVSGITHTFSVWLRTATGTTNARIGSSNTGVVSTITVTDTWQRFSCQYVTNGANDGGAVYSQTGSPSATMYVWGAQVQPGSIVGDLIQTSGTQNYSTPRFDYSPTNIGEPRGLLIEGQGIAINNYGEDFSNAYWSKVACSVSATSVAGPDNVSTATRRIVESSTTDQHVLRRGITTTAGTTYTVSVYVKPGSYNTFGFELYWSAAYNAKAEVTSISGDTATVTSATGVNATLSRTVMTASGWYRYALTFTHPSGVTGTITPDFNVALKQTNTYVGNGTNYMDVYGFMLEAGSGASSYIPTGASQVTRTSESCTISGTNFSSWFTQGEGTLYAYSDVIKSNNRNLVARIENAGATNYIEMGLNAVGYTTEAVAYAGGAFTSLGSAYTPVVNVPYKSAYTWSNGRLNLGANGTTPTAVSATLVTDLICIGIGGGFGMTDIYLRNGHIRQLKYYPMVMTNAQLQALTAP